MDPPKLAVSLRDHVAVVGNDLSINLFSFAAKTMAEAGAIATLAYDVSFLSAELRNLAELIMRMPPPDTVTFSPVALGKIQHWSTECLAMFSEVDGSVTKANKLIRGRARKFQSGIKLSQSEQEECSLAPSDLGFLSTAISRLKWSLMLVFHLGDLALDIKAAMISVRTSSCEGSVFGPSRSDRLSGPRVDLLAGSWRQDKIDTILASHMVQGSVLKLGISATQVIMEQENSQPSEPKDSSEEDFEMVDTPSTLPGSPVYVECENAPEYSCTDIQDPTLPEYNDATGHKRHLNIDAFDEAAASVNLRHNGGDDHLKIKVKSWSPQGVIRQAMSQRGEVPLLPAKGEFAASRHGSQVDTVQTAPMPQRDRALTEYQMQLILLDQQHKKRLLMALQDTMPSPAPARGKTKSVQDLQTQPTLGEQHNKRQTLLKHADYGERAISPPQTPLGPRDNHALQDYDMHLMLLEQQQDRRAITRCGRAVQRSGVPQTAASATELKDPFKNDQIHFRPSEQQQPPPAIGGEHERNSPAVQPAAPALLALTDYHLQLRQLEQQSKVRFRMAAKEQILSAEHVEIDGDLLMDPCPFVCCAEQHSYTQPDLNLPRYGQPSRTRDPASTTLAQACNTLTKQPTPDTQTASAINHRTMAILEKHDLKSEKLDSDTISMLQAATEEQLERFIKAWASSEGAFQQLKPMPSQRDGKSLTTPFKPSLPNWYNAESAQKEDSLSTLPEAAAKQVLRGQLCSSCSRLAKPTPPVGCAETSEQERRLAELQTWVTETLQQGAKNQQAVWIIQPKLAQAAQQWREYAGISAPDRVIKYHQKQLPFTMEACRVMIKRLSNMRQELEHLRAHMQLGNMTKSEQMRLRFMQQEKQTIEQQRKVIEMELRQSEEDQEDVLKYLEGIRKLFQKLGVERQDPRQAEQEQLQVAKQYQAQQQQRQAEKQQRVMKELNPLAQFEADALKKTSDPPTKLVEGFEKLAQKQTEKPLSIGERRGTSAFGGPAYEMELDSEDENAMDEEIAEIQKAKQQQPRLRGLNRIAQLEAIATKRTFDHGCDSVEEVEKRRHANSHFKLLKSRNASFDKICVYDAENGEVAEESSAEAREAGDGEKAEKKLDEEQEAGLKVVEELLREYTTLYDTLG